MTLDEALTLIGKLKRKIRAAREARLAEKKALEVRIMGLENDIMKLTAQCEAAESSLFALRHSNK